MRALIHVPHGVIAVLLLHAHPNIGWAFLITFLLYELWQGKRTQDMGFKDILGTLYGMVAAGIGILIWTLLS